MRHRWPLLVLAVVLGCGRESDDSLSPRNNRYAINDPLGDTLVTPFASARAHDLLTLQATPHHDTLLLVMRFANLVQPNSTRTHESVLGIVDFDVDDDARTGLPAVADDFGGSSQLGAEWTLFLDDSTVAPGDRRVALMHLSTNAIVWVPSRFEGTVVTTRIPLAVLGISHNARMRMVGIVGSIERASDIVPNEGSLAIDVP